MISNTRLYAAAIAFSSGLYSIWSASTASRMTSSGLLMGALGAIVIVHGAVLLTAHADRLAGWSGPLMIGYALVMLLNQLLVGTGMVGGSGTMGTGGAGMTGGMRGSGMGGSGMASGMGWDPGMVALAALMLASGAIMARGPRMGDGGNEMSR